MMKAIICCALALGFPASIFAQEPVEQEDDANTAAEAERPEPEEGQLTTLSGMSILGNEEAPKSLVIVPWKSSELGAELGLSNALDDRAKPIDRDVFMRELSYYNLRTGK